MKKILSLSLLSLLLASLFVFPANAEENTAPSALNGTAPSTEQSTAPLPDAAVTPDTDTAPTQPDKTDPADTDTAPSESTPPVSEPSEGEAKTPLTSALADFFTENGNVLLSLLTFIGSLFVALLYKTGLLPLVRSALSALTETAGKTGSATEEFTAAAKETLSAIDEKCTPLLGVAEENRETVLSMQERLLALEDSLALAEKERRKATAILATETSLFYELLSSVNLPEAQKESMADSYYRLKRTLEEEEA